MNYRPRSLRTTLLLGTAFLAGVAIGPASDLIAKHLVRGLGINAAFAQVTDRANTYRLLTLFGDVFERVRSEYVDPVSDKELMENAHQRHADRPRSALRLHERRRVPRDAGGYQGKFGGIGIEVVPENGFLKVISRNGRHARLQGRYQGGRHHHTAERQVGAGALAGEHD